MTLASENIIAKFDLQAHHSRPKSESPLRTKEGYKALMHTYRVVIHGKVSLSKSIFE